MSLDVAVRQVLLDLGFERKFNPDQPRDPDGKFGSGASGELPGDDQDDEFDDEDEFDNDERFPESYLSRYGYVTHETAVGADDLFVAITDKGNFHIARGEADRHVVAEMNSVKARAFADLIYRYNAEQPPETTVFRPLDGARVSSTGSGGVRIEWADGSSSDLDDEAAFGMQEVLMDMAGTAEESEVDDDDD